jgi:hypothetical protein
MAFKKLSDKQRKAVEMEVKLMLHAHRDALRNRWRFDLSEIDPKQTCWDIQDGYYGEAFGIMRGLAALGYGHSDDLRAWFNMLLSEVAAEENFHGNHECDFCLNYYGKDDAGRILDFPATYEFRKKYSAEREKVGLK